MKWNLRMVAAQRDIWRPTQLMEVFHEVGFTPSLSKVAALWSGTPVTVRLDDLDMICTALGCTVVDLLEHHEVERSVAPGRAQRPAVGAEGGVRPVPGSGGSRGPRRPPPN